MKTINSNPAENLRALHPRASRWRRAARILAVAAILGVATARTGLADIAILIREGDTAASGGITFDEFSLPTINSAGQVSYTVALDHATSATDTGIYRQTIDVLPPTQIARESDAAPGGSILAPLFGPSNANRSTTLTAAGQVIFTGPDTFNHANGIFREDGIAANNLRLVGLSEAAPDGNGVFDALPSVFSWNGNGSVAFYGTLTGTARNTSDDEGIFRVSTAGSVVQIAREGGAAPNGNGTFGVNLATNTAFGPASQNDSGTVAFFAGVTGSTTVIPGTTSSFDAGVFSGNGGSIAQLARAGQTGLNGGGTITGLSSLPVINQSGQVAMVMTLDRDTRSGNAPANSIYRSAGSTLTEIAYRGENLPGGGFIYGLSSAVAINDGGEVANLIQTDTSGHANAGSGGIIRGDGSTLTVIARNGESTPRGGVTIISSFTGNTFAMNAHGDVAFTAGLDTNPSDIVPTDSEGLFFHSDTGGLVEIAQLGDVLDGSTITALDFAGTSTNNAVDRFQSGLNDAGTVVFRYKLANGTQGIAAWNVVYGPADLSGLTLSTGTLTPAFRTATTSYTVSVPYATTTITVTPTVPVATSTVQVNGTTVASGTASGPISLAAGANSIAVVVTAQDGTTKRTYTISVNRALPSTNAALSSLALSAGTLSPAFASATTSYTATVSNATASLAVTPTVADPTATVQVNGTAGTSGVASGAISLAVGNNTITTVVTAQDGVTAKTYTVVVHRKSADATLSALTLSGIPLNPAFDSATTSYTASVPYPTTSTTVSATANNAGATVSGNTGSQTLAVGLNTLNIVVTAEDGNTQTYTAIVTRAAASTNAALSNLVLGAGSLNPAFSSSTTSYTAKVSNTTTSTTVKPTVADATATVKVNGIAVTSGTASGAISLAVGNTTITTVVTAQDGVTTQTYTVLVHRNSADATLSALALSGLTLTPAFGSATTSYTASVPFTTTSTTVSATANNAAATVSGSLGSQALAIGANTLSILVTAEDGNTRTYTVTVTRLPTPIVTTLTQTNLAATSVTLNGTVNANGVSTKASFNYGLTSSYGSTIATTPATVTGQSATAVSANLTGLKPLTTYHYQVKGVNTSGTGLGADMMFTTLNNVATLSGLVLSSGPLTPVFKSATLSYTATVSNTTATVMLTPTVTDSNATVTVNGLTVLSGSASAPINLNVGSNSIPVKVTAQDGTTTKTYTVKVTRTALVATMTKAPATNVGTTTATLNGTVVANNANTTLSFDYGTTTSYGKTLTATPSTANGTTSTGFSATPAGLTPGTLYHFRAQGVNVAGTANGGDLTFTTIDNAAKLSALKLSKGTLSPAFASGTKVYAATVANTVTSITVTPTVVANSHATVTVNGVPVTSGTASGPVNLDPGPNVITLVITAQDGVTVGTYTVNVTRTTPRPVVVTKAATSVGSTSAILNGTVNASNTSTTPSFEYGLTTSYGSTIGATPTPLTGSTVTPVSATVPNLLPAKTYHYRVVAVNVGGTSNGTDLTFTTPDNVATLSKLVLSTGAMNQTFSPATTTYTQAVPGNTTSLIVTPTVTANSHATVTVNGTAVPSGSKSAAQALVTGDNIINVVVTAQNGTTTTTYTITVTVPVAASVVQAESQPTAPLLSAAPAPIKAQLIGPVANGGVLPGATVTFAWNAGRNTSAYRLSIGRTEGGTDLYDGVQGLALSYTVTLPTDGAELYVTLSSMINGAWLPNNYLFTAADTTVKAVVITPADQSVLTAATQTFTWQAVPGAKEYWLSIGSTEDGTDLYNASQGLALTQSVTLPTDGRELFVTLQTSRDGQWVASNSTLTTAGTGAPVAAQLTSPADQSVLPGGIVTFTWDAGSGVSEYWLSLGTSPAAADLYTASQGSNKTVTITVPTDGSPLYLTLSSLLNGQWHSSQYLLQAAVPP